MILIRGSPLGDTSHTRRAPRIGILQFIPQLEDAAWGFVGAIEKNLGRAVDHEILDAGGLEKNCPRLARRLVKQGCDLLLGCLTPAAAALKEATARTGTPVLFAPVFHPLLAGLIESERLPGGNVTGVCGRLDPNAKIDKLLLLFPELAEIAVIADRNDDLSLWEARLLSAAFESRGIRSMIDEVRSSHPEPVRRGLVHLLVFSPDLEETMEDWIRVFYEARAPVVGSSARAGFLGALMAVYADHGVLGTIAGEMAAEILRGADPALMAVRHPPEAVFGFSHKAAGRLGIRIPVPLAQSADIF